jgi:hypothetical protein
MRSITETAAPVRKSALDSSGRLAGSKSGAVRRFATMMLAPLLLTAVLVACGEDASVPSSEALPPGVSPAVDVETESEAEFQKGAEIPVPAGDPILTISGDLRSKNADNTLVLDLEALGKLGSVSYVTTPPGASKEVRYTGVLLTTILRVAGNPQAVAITPTAGNGRDARIPIQSILDQPVMLAFEADGKPLEGGDAPLLIVFPYEALDDPAAAAEMSIGGVVQLIID